MSASPSLEMQGFIVNTLKSDAGVQALVGQRVYDRIPDNPVFPYISMGPMQEINEYPDCIDGAELAVQIDAWSRAVGSPEVKRIANAVHVALNDADVDLPVNACCYLTLTNTIHLRDPDGITEHAAMTLEAFVERRP